MQRERFPHAYRQNWTGNPAPPPADRIRGTLFFWILPHMEQGPFYMQSAMDAGAGNRFPSATVAAGAAWHHEMPAYYCPSDVTKNYFNNETKSPPEWALANYLLNYQLFVGDYNGTEYRDQPPCKDRDVTDGFSNTIAFAETVRKCGGMPKQAVVQVISGPMVTGTCSISQCLVVEKPIQVVQNIATNT